MKPTTKQLALTTLTMITLSFMSCQKESELDTIKDAQMCLNKAAPAAAQGCISKLSSLDTPQANQLKCSAYFIQEGLGTPTKLIEALDPDQSNDGSCGTCTSSMAIISQLKFTSASTPTENIANAQAAFDVCKTSGVSIYTQLSSMVNISTLAGAALPASATVQQIATSLASTVDATTLGNIAIQTFTSSCNTTGSGNSGDSQLQQYCTELNNAGAATAAPSVVGDCVKYKLTGAGYPGLPCPL